MATTEPRDLIEVLGRMESWRQDSAVERNRKFRRFIVRGEALLEPAISSKGAHIGARAMLRDISRAGVGFLSDCSLQPGEVWRIRFQNKEYFIGQQTIMIKFCRPVRNNLFLAGAQFILEPSLMLALGVDENELHDDMFIADRSLDTADFLPPESTP